MKNLRTSSIPEPRRTRRVLAGLACLTLLAALLSICLGSTFISPALVPRALLGQLEGTLEGDIVLLARLPRTCGCLLAGMALAVSGAVIQSVLNNPLAAPNIIGVNSGAGLMVVLCSALFPQSVTLTPLAAFLGAFLGVLLVLLIAERTGASRITLVLAGDGPLLEPAKAQVAELGLEELVKFIGFRKDIKNLYKGSDLYVNSSRHEALSFLIIEAMAAGLPVIATDMGGNSDIVNDEAGCGMLVEYDNPDSMAVAMKCFLEDPAFAARCRENALRTVQEKFEIHKMAKATYGVYEKALHD